MKTAKKSGKKKTTVHVGEHYKHQRFEANVLAATGGKNLLTAAQKWTWEKTGHSHRQLHCQICNERINNFVVLKNISNGTRLVIGNNCYDKWLQFLSTGDVETTLPNRKAMVKGLKDYHSQVVKGLKAHPKDKVSNKTFLGWFLEQVEIKALPKKIVRIVGHLQAVGFSQTKADSEALAAYYRAHRKFPVAVVIGQYYLKTLAKLRPEIKELTLDEVPAIKKLLSDYYEEYNERHKYFFKQIENSMARFWFAEKLRDGLVSDELKPIIERLDHDIIPTKAETDLLTEFYRTYRQAELAKKFAALQAKVTKDGHENESWFTDLQKRCEAITLDNQKDLSSLDTDLAWYVRAVQQPAVYFGVHVIAKGQNNKWQRFNTGLNHKPMAAVVLAIFNERFPDRFEGIRTVREIKTEDLPSADFNTRSTKNTGEYVGKTETGKPILASHLCPMVKTPGTHKYFVMDEKDKFVIAWVF